MVFFLFDQFGVPGTENQYLTRTNGFAPPLGTPPLPLPRPLEQVPARKHPLPPPTPTLPDNLDIENFQNHPQRL